MSKVDQAHQPSYGVALIIICCPCPYYLLSLPLVPRLSIAIIINFDLVSMCTNVKNILKINKEDERSAINFMIRIYQRGEKQSS